MAVVANLHVDSGMGTAGGAMRRRDTDVHEDEGANQKTVRVGKRIEGAAYTRSHGQAIEAVAQIDGRPAYGCGTQSLAQEPHVIEFILCDFEGILLQCRSGKADHGSTADGASAGTRIRRRESLTGSCTKVKLRFQILKIKSEIKNVRVGNRRIGDWGWFG